MAELSKNIFFHKIFSSNDDLRSKLTKINEKINDTKEILLLILSFCTYCIYIYSQNYPDDPGGETLVDRF